MPYRFREARLQAGLTTVQLAQKMGLTQAAVSQWESGKKVPGIETISRLADLYGVTVDNLLGRDTGPGNVGCYLQKNWTPLPYPFSMVSPSGIPCTVGAL